MLPENPTPQVRLFRTCRYSGAWFPTGGDRTTTRLRVEATLREAISDPEGKLAVDRSGPRWVGTREIGLSYAHDEDSVFLVWTPDGSPIGVDLEPEHRRPKHPVTEIASRFFHRSESDALGGLPESSQTEAFLDLWLKKEAVAKLTRKGLVYSLPLNLDGLETFEYEEPALLPEGKRAVLAFFKK